MGELIERTELNALGEPRMFHWQEEVILRECRRVLVSHLGNEAEEGLYDPRDGAISLLSAMEGKAIGALDAVLVQLHAGDGYGRASACRLLASMDKKGTHPEIEAELRGALEDGDSSVRRSAAESLRGRATVAEETARLLWLAIEDSDPLVRLGAAEALSGIPAEVAKSNPWQLLLRDPDDRVRRRAIYEITGKER